MQQKYDTSAAHFTLHYVAGTYPGFWKLLEIMKIIYGFKLQNHKINKNTIKISILSAMCEHQCPNGGSTPQDLQQQ